MEVQFRIKENANVIKAICMKNTTITTITTIIILLTQVTQTGDITIKINQHFPLKYKTQRRYV